MPEIYPSDYYLLLFGLQFFLNCVYFVFNFLWNSEFYVFIEIVKYNDVMGFGNKFVLLIYDLVKYAKTCVLYRINARKDTYISRIKQWFFELATD